MEEILPDGKILVRVVFKLSLLGMFSDCFYNIII